MTKNLQFGKNFSQLPDTDHVSVIELNSSDSEKYHLIENIPGKQASVKIFYGISQANGYQITAHVARLGLEMFGEYVQEEKQTPNSHPNIRLLIDTIEYNRRWLVNIK